jgi:hypothetical protein
MLVPPKRVCMMTIRSGSSRISLMPAAFPAHSLYETFRSSLSAIQTLIMD